MSKVANKVERYEVGDEESSSGEEDDDITGHLTYDSSPIENQAVFDEELEVFGTDHTTLNKQSNVTTANSNLEAFHSKEFTSKSINPPDVDVFSLEYKPHIVQTKKAVDLVNEKDIIDLPTIIPATINTKINDEDDEFDFTSPVDNSNVTVSKVIPSLPDPTLNEDRFIQDDSHLNASDSLRESRTLSGLKESAVKYNVWRAAHSSLSEITTVYGAGLGDMEVRLLDSDTDSLSHEPLSTVDFNKPSAWTLITQSIAEGDEEEAAALEMQEALDEEMQALAKAQELEQWDRIGTSHPSADIDSDVSQLNETSSSSVASCACMSYQEAWSHFRYCVQYAYVNVYRMLF